MDRLQLIRMLKPSVDLYAISAKHASNLQSSKSFILQHAIANNYKTRGSIGYANMMYKMVLA